MPAREWYRRKAGACAAAAENMVEPADRAVMLEIARAYMTLADHVGARHDQGTTHRDGDDRAASGPGRPQRAKT
jgi:hypothetical protein